MRFLVDDGKVAVNGASSLLGRLAIGHKVLVRVLIDIRHLARLAQVCEQRVIRLDLCHLLHLISVDRVVPTVHSSLSMLIDRAHDSHHVFDVLSFIASLFDPLFQHLKHPVRRVPAFRQLFDCACNEYEREDLLSVSSHKEKGKEKGQTRGAVDKVDVVRC